MALRINKVRFPHYLRSGVDHEALRWFGNQLKIIRGKEHLKLVAARARTTIDQLRAIEQGQFRVKLGCLREIIAHGYNVSLDDLLKQYFDAFRNRVSPHSAVGGKERPFERDYHYSLRLEDSKDGKQKATPLLVGGDPENFLWAIPLRRLKQQLVATELLELAPARKSKISGVTPDGSHGGVEVIHVIFGTVQVSLSTRNEGRVVPRLSRGDTIHLNGRNSHQIENVEKNTPALLLIVRLPT